MSNVFLLAVNIYQIPWSVSVTYVFQKSMLILLSDKINQWGPNFREGYTRLGLLKPFLAENSGIFLLTATATAEDMKVSASIWQILL